MKLKNNIYNQYNNLDEWLNYLENDIRSNVIKLGLSNITKAAEALKLVKPAEYVVTVAGTNGKGTVVKTLEYLLYHHGYKVASYTSPHLINFNERISINLSPVSDKVLINGFNYIKKKLDENQLAVTYFEFVTLTAWHIFCESNKTNQLDAIDVAVLEIGLGGRLDAVNVIPKDLAIITNIDYDHQEFLGNNLEDIGYEKAGIIENNKPVILGSENFPNSVIEVANQKINNNIYQYKKDYEYNLTKNNLLDNNLSTAIKAFDIVNNYFNINYKKNYNKNIEFNLDKIIKLIKNFNIPGRCSWLDDNKTILIDVAHNQQSVQNLYHFLLELKKNKKVKITAICGMLADKDIKTNLAVIQPLIEQWNLVSIVDKRGASYNQLLDNLLKINNNIKYNCFDNIKNCFNKCYAINNQEINNNSNSILVIFGSFYLVGPICRYYTDMQNS